VVSLVSSETINSKHSYIHNSCKFYGVNQLGQNCIILEYVKIGYPAKAVLDRILSSGKQIDSYNFTGTCIGDNALIRPNSTIYGDVTIGNGLRTGHNTMIRENTCIGDNVLVGTNVIIDGNTTIG